MAKQATKPAPRPAPQRPQQQQKTLPPRQAAPANVPAVQKAGLPAGYDYGQAAGVGAGDITAADMLLPFVRIIQTNSPELNKRHEKYVDGAEAGMFFNVSTKRLYPGEAGFPFHLCFKLRSYAEFKPRDTGGGFVGQHDPEDERVVALRQAQGKFGKLVDEQAGTELTETYYATGVIPPINKGDEAEPAVLPIASTGITPFKQFLMVLNPLLRRGAPIFAPRILVSSKFSSNKDGDFFKWNFRLDGGSPEEYLMRPADPLMTACLDLRQSVETGTAKVDYAKAQGDDPDVPF